MSQSLVMGVNCHNLVLNRILCRVYDTEHDECLRNLLFWSDICESELSHVILCIRLDETDVAGHIIKCAALVSSISIVPLEMLGESASISAM